MKNFPPQMSAHLSVREDVLLLRTNEVGGTWGSDCFNICVKWQGGGGKGEGRRFGYLFSAKAWREFLPHPLHCCSVYTNLSSRVQGRSENAKQESAEEAFEDLRLPRGEPHGHGLGHSLAWCPTTLCLSQGYL